MRLSKKSATLTTAIVLCLPFATASQESVDLAIVDRIKTEAFARSDVMEHLRQLTDVHGPRLTGSPGFEKAAAWATERLKGYGLSNVNIERWGPFGRSWSIESYSVELLAPHYMRLAAVPLAWSSSTAGSLTGQPVLAPLSGGFASGPKKIQESLDAYRREWKGKLRGKIVLSTPIRPESPREKGPFTRLTDQELAKLSNAPDPVKLEPVNRIEDLPRARERRRRLQDVHDHTRALDRAADRAVRRARARS